MDGDLPRRLARQRWELENNIVATDEIYRYDEAADARTRQEKAWTTDPHYFKRVKISAVALLKMVVHARSGGGTTEVMGLMQGKTDGDTIIVMDAFALPLEGTETTCNGAYFNSTDAYEYTLNHMLYNKQVGRREDLVGWYHSHPGYGCWLSDSDVSTQADNQHNQDPFLAVVIDPIRTVSAGKVEIGAFRTHPQGYKPPEGYKPPDEPVPEYQTIPLSKIEDFGVHRNYALDITYFKSSLDSHLLDLLWNKYWVNTLSSSPILASRDCVAGQIIDIADKLEQADNQMASAPYGSYTGSSQRKKEPEESQLTKIARDSSKLSAEQVHGLMSQVIKDILFNSNRYHQCSSDVSEPEPMVED